MAEPEATDVTLSPEPAHSNVKFLKEESPTRQSGRKITKRPSLADRAPSSRRSNVAAAAAPSITEEKQGAASPAPAETAAPAPAETSPTAATAEAVQRVEARVQRSSSVHEAVAIFEAVAVREVDVAAASTPRRHSGAGLGGSACLTPPSGASSSSSVTGAFMATAHPGSPGSPCTPGTMAATMAAREGNALIAAPAASPDAASLRRIAALRSSQLAGPPKLAESTAASPGSPSYRDRSITPGTMAALMAAREGNALVEAPATSPDSASRRRLAALRSSQLASPPPFICTTSVSPRSSCADRPTTPGTMAALMAAREGNALVEAPATSPDMASRRRLAALRSAHGSEFAGPADETGAGGGGGGSGGYVGTPRDGVGDKGPKKAQGVAVAWWDLCRCLEKCAPKS